MSDTSKDLSVEGKHIFGLRKGLRGQVRLKNKIRLNKIVVGNRINQGHERMGSFRPGNSTVVLNVTGEG